MPFIQGVLTVRVIQAANLPSQNSGSVDPFGLISRKTLGVNSSIKAYAKIYLDEIHLRSTSDWIHADHQNPAWDQSFTFLLCHDASDLVIKIQDRNKNIANLNTESLVDQVKIPVQWVLEGRLSPDGWYDLSKRSGKMRLHLIFQKSGASSAPTAQPRPHLPPSRPPPPSGGFASQGSQPYNQAHPAPPPYATTGAPMQPYGPPGGAPFAHPGPAHHYPPPGHAPQYGTHYGSPGPQSPVGGGIGFESIAGVDTPIYPSLQGMDPAPLAPLPPRPLAGPSKQREVASYFPITEGNLVTLYQDTDTPMLPCFNGVPFPDGSQYVPPCAWKDIYNAINNAREFVFVAGWSVWTELSLIRDDEEWKKRSHLGRLLRRKADEGLTVAVIVWDDQSSWNVPYFHDLLEKGMMTTHDEATYKYFNEPDCKVTCLKQSREPKSDLSGGGSTGGGGLLCTIGGGVQSIMGAINKEVAPRLLYTHHQKTVVVDDPNTRQMIAFVGGLDLTQGRFDSPQFTLFRTLRNFHRGDFRNKCYPGVTEDTGPREPWHDIHSQVRGPAALQVLANFHERYWRCQGSRIVDDDVTRTICAAYASYNQPIAAPNAWNVQTLRSISSDSAKFLNEGRHTFLQSHKSEMIDDGIARAYVQAIQNAERFIYIENQYFLGSSYAWTKGVSDRATHVIPMEIVQKILAKIAAGQDFTCYVLIPMFPEGDPNGTAGQEILLYQYRTIDFMYRRIVSALKTHQSQKHPTDYLSFFCLGKQECPDETLGVFEGEFSAKQPVDPASNPAVLRQTLRHPVYVHSKMMIVDDDYIIVGSANINQRSLDGNRDSEIAVGAWQPGHQLAGNQPPRGEIATFRMALWAAHLGSFDPLFVDPANPACVAMVREKAEQFWDVYRCDNLTDQSYQIHLLPYPIRINPETGEVNALDSPFDCFPDTKASVIGGNRSALLPVMVKKKLIA